MAAWLIPGGPQRIGAARVLGALAVALIAACACASSAPQADLPPVARQTAQASLSPVMAGTSRLLTDALASQGIRLDIPAVPVQRGEPATVATAARVLLQADVHDPDGGHVLIYEFADAATAAIRGSEFADYLEGGPGQINFPLDTQFSLAQVGSTLVFTWWSAERSSDRALAERAFDTMAGVGQSIPVTK